MTRIGGIPEDFEAAYGGLAGLVESIGSGEVLEELVPEKADEYRRVHCRGSAALAGSALRALSYEFSSSGLQEEATSYPQELQALALVEAALEPAPATHAAGNETSEIIEVALPEQLRETMPNCRGFVMGELQMIFEPTPGKPPYAHMSVSHPSLPSLILQKNGLLALTLLFGVKWEVLCVSISLSPTSWPLA